MKQVIKVLLLALLALTSTVIAHPGHGLEGGAFSLWHYLSEPLHVASIISVVVLIVVSVYWIQKNRLSANKRGI